RGGHLVCHRTRYSRTVPCPPVRSKRPLLDYCHSGGSHDERRSTMNPQKQTWLEAFVSLAWYEVFLRFIANFVAKSAELLLAAGLVVSSANFLTDGAVLVTGSVAFQAWSWVQSLAIDSSLGISFYYVLYCFKQRDWIKFSLYSVLTVLLTLVAGII